MDYPIAQRQNIYDDFHGTLVADPYRWLEDAEASETIAFTKAQNALTKQFLDIPAREIISDHLHNILNYPKYSTPFKKGGRYFFSKNDGLQNHSILYVSETLNAQPTMVIDPNQFSKDGSVSMGIVSVSENGKWLAYGKSQSGSDRQTVRILEIDTGRELNETIEHLSFSSIAWDKNSDGFYYNRNPKIGSVPNEDLHNFSSVYWHQLGTDQNDDKLIMDAPNDKERGFYPFLSDDFEYLLLYISYGTEPENRVYYRKTNSNGEFIKLLDKADASYHFVGNIGTQFYFQTDLNAPNSRLISIDIENPSRKNWHEIIPESENSISYIGLIGGQFVVSYLKNVHHEIQIFDLTGQFLHTIPMPAMGSTWGFYGKQNDTEAFFSFESFLYPPTIYHYDIEQQKISEFRRSAFDFDASKFETKQIFCTSKDGTKIPLFVTHKKGINLDNTNPTLLYGYGGFNHSLTPFFSSSKTIWLEKGGIFVVANIRGGNEFGKEWHRSGILANKQNVFDDFIASAEFLIENGYTNSEKLAIQGGSNGGLLVAACAVQQPELFGAVICQVPVIDMLRYHKFTVGRFWINEYGNPENPEHFKFLIQYSPLHNVKKGEIYPPILINSADTDDRVVPAHAKKFAATLQANDSGEHPLLLRIEMKAGHGHGKSMQKIIEEITDEYAFLFKIFEMNW